MMWEYVHGHPTGGDENPTRGDENPTSMLRSSIDSNYMYWIVWTGPHCLDLLHLLFTVYLFTVIRILSTHISDL